MIKVGLFVYSDHFMYKLHKRMDLLSSLSIQILPEDKKSEFYATDMEIVKLFHIANLLDKSN